MGKLTKAQEAERQAEIVKLRELLPPGSTVTTVLRHVSTSGMSRVVEPMVFVNNEARYLTYSVSIILGWASSKNHEGIVVTGCGMDTGFQLVHTLSSVLYPDGFECVGDGCPSNDHSNGMHERGAGVHHKSGGYALKHRWL